MVSSDTPSSNDHHRGDFRRSDEAAQRDAARQLRAVLRERDDALRYVHHFDNSLMNCFLSPNLEVEFPNPPIFCLGRSGSSSTRSPYRENTLQDHQRQVRHEHYDRRLRIKKRQSRQSPSPSGGSDNRRRSASPEDHRARRSIAPDFYPPLSTNQSDNRNASRSWKQNMCHTCHQYGHTSSECTAHKSTRSGPQPWSDKVAGGDQRV
ncbi:hypothetical protein GGS21DRAFT_251349 [Xylaria nigripes]|nr:hypothetical protein GGS21DRAFT_251349 [Xylaria nigripes]